MLYDVTTWSWVNLVNPVDAHGPVDHDSVGLAQARPNNASYWYRGSTGIDSFTDPHVMVQTSPCLYSLHKKMYSKLWATPSY